MSQVGRDDPEGGGLAAIGRWPEADTRLLERLTASDLFLLLWDDYGWSTDIGGLAIVDGTCLLDGDGRVRIEEVRRKLEPRLHQVPRFRQLLFRPRLGFGWPLWIDAPSFDIANHVRVRQVAAAPGDEAELLQACQELTRHRLDPARPLWELWLLPGLPEDRVGVYFRVHHAFADGAAALAAFGGCLDLTPDAPTPTALRGRRYRSPRAPSCWATTYAGADRSSVAGGRASPIRGGHCAAPGKPGRRGGRSWLSGPRRGRASTARSATAAAWRLSAAAWTLPSRSPTSTTPRSTTWC